MVWKCIHVLTISFVLSFILTPFFRWLARRLRILDNPDARKIHDETTPLLGGASVFIAFAAAFSFYNVYLVEIVVIMCAAGVLFVTGVADDCIEVPASVKLVVQVLCTSAVIISGVVLRVVPESLGIFADVTNVLLTFLWIIGITNAMNFFDGMDGLAAGLGAIISFFLGVVTIQAGQPVLGCISLAMMGSCIGFLPYNFKPKKNASIFLGDAGSTVIGFVLACAAVYLDWADNDPVVALASPLLIFWILIFDMIHITVDRIVTGKVKTFRQWVEYVGKDHLHHRIASVLGGKKKSVFFIYFLSICLGTSAVVLRNARPVDALLLIGQACILVILITILERRGRTISAENGRENCID